MPGYPLSPLSICMFACRGQQGWLDLGPAGIDQGQGPPRSSRCCWRWRLASPFCMECMHGGLPPGLLFQMRLMHQLLMLWMLSWGRERMKGQAQQPAQGQATEGAPGAQALPQRPSRLHGRPCHLPHLSCTSTREQWRRRQCSRGRRTGPCNKRSSRTQRPL